MLDSEILELIDRLNKYMKENNISSKEVALVTDIPVNIIEAACDKVCRPNDSIVRNIKEYLSREAEKESSIKARQKSNPPLIKEGESKEDIYLSYLFACAKARRILSKLPKNQVESIEGIDDINSALNYLEKYVID